MKDGGSLSKTIKVTQDNPRYEDVEKEIKVVLNMKSGSLKFIVDGEDKEISYYSLPTDKPLVPIVFLYHKNDSIEIIDC